MNLHQQQQYDKLVFVEQLIKISKDMALYHGDNISDNKAWQMVQDIVHNTYPKLCVKYITKQDWRL